MSLRLSSWPYVVVRIDCRLCPRRGCYRLARLAVRYGPDFELERLLAHIASDCPWWRPHARKYDPRCGARLTDLDRATLPDLPPGVETDLLRRRPPPREDVSQRKVAKAATWDAPMLSGVQSAVLILSCQRCGRREEHAVAKLLALGDMRLIDLRYVLTADCVRRASANIRDRCDTMLTER